MINAVDRYLAKLYRYFPLMIRRKIECGYAALCTLGVPELADPVLTSREMQATKKLSIIVPIHNAFDCTERCLKSLERCAAQAEVILVDDGSTDSRIPLIVQSFATRNGWKSIQRPQGSGHSLACTAGVELATRPILCLLNSDTVVTHRSFVAPISLLLEDRSIGAVGPAISQGWGPQLDLRGKRCRYIISDEKILGLAESRARRFAHQSPRDIPKFVDGCALFISRCVWDAVGGFSDCRPHYGNDVDLCAKLLARDLRLVVCDAAYVHHLGGKSSV